MPRVNTLVDFPDNTFTTLEGYEKKIFYLIRIKAKNIL